MCPSHEALEPSTCLVGSRLTGSAPGLQKISPELRRVSRGVLVVDVAVSAAEDCCDQEVRMTQVAMKLEKVKRNIGLPLEVSSAKYRCGDKSRVPQGERDVT